MRYTLPYGKSELSFTLPADAAGDVVRPPEVTPCHDAFEEITRALDNPVCSPPVEELVQAGRRVCIISDDITRPTPSGLILQAMLPRLLGAGIRKQDIRIVMALGSHRRMTPDEMVSKLGRDITEQYDVQNSEFKDPAGLMLLGKTPAGSDIMVSKNVMDSDIRIGIGNIVPHPAMGWSGGAKILYPGVTSEQTVTQFHMLQGTAEQNLFGLDECYVRLEVEKWTDTVGLHFIVNTVHTADLKLYRAVAGHYIHAHRQGVLYARQSCGVPLRGKAEVVVVSSYPVDIDYWQATKGYLAADHAARDGATLILVTPCPEGVGPHPEYLDFIGNDEAEALAWRIVKGQPVDGDPLALCVGACVSKIRRRHSLVTVSDGLAPESLARAKIAHYPAARLQEAVDVACAAYAAPRVLVITHGGETVVYNA